MERHVVFSNKSEITCDPRLDPICQDFVVTAPDGKKYNRSCMNMDALFKPGDVIKVYTTNDKFLPMEYACSYKLGGRFFVELQQPPVYFLRGAQDLSDSGVRGFYSKLGFVDAVRLNYDIARVLWQRRIMPSIFWQNNLRMFLQQSFR